MKIYTKTGDEGQTGLFAGPRVWKDDARLDAYGVVDELNAAIGMARSESPAAELEEVLERIQHGLFSVGAEFATPDPQAHGTALIDDREIAWLEATIDKHDALLPPLTAFILPGGTRAAAAIHLARTICRRAERCVVRGMRSGEPFSDSVLKYLNRLSDLLFVLARAANAAAGQQDVTWKKPS